MPGFSQEKLRSRRRNEPGYGSGVYTVPQEDIDKYLQNGNQKKEKLKVQLRSLLKSFMDNRNNPKKMQSIMEEIKVVKQQLQKAASIEKNRIKARKALQKRILRVSKALEKMQAKRCHNT